MMARRQPQDASGRVLDARLSFRPQSSLPGIRRRFFLIAARLCRLLLSYQFSRTFVRNIRRWARACCRRATQALTTPLRNAKVSWGLSQLQPLLSFRCDEIRAASSPGWSREIEPLIDAPFGQILRVSPAFFARTRLCQCIQDRAREAIDLPVPASLSFYSFPKGEEYKYYRSDRSSTDSGRAAWRRPGMTTLQIPRAG